MPDQTVIAKKGASKPDRGIVAFARQCIKQDATAVQEMEASLLYAGRIA